ncbi:MAG: hypothetical protein EBU66_13150 [Bacteroidetes bacterium]|nr:hypothetical protein [Bacteroidota bacterium]
MGDFNQPDAALKPDEQSVDPALSAKPGNGSGGDQSAGRRKRSNPWLAHVKETMKKNRGVSFKKILKLAKKSFKKSKSYNKRKSQSQSHSGGKKRAAKKGGSSVAGLDMEKLLGQQKGGSGVGGGKEGMAKFGESASPVA